MIGVKRVYVKEDCLKGLDVLYNEIILIDIKRVLFSCWICTRESGD